MTHVLNALIETDRVAVLSGNPEPVAVPTDSGRPHHIYRCPCRRTLDPNQPNQPKRPEGAVGQNRLVNGGVTAKAATLIEDRLGTSRNDGPLATQAMAEQKEAGQQRPAKYCLLYVGCRCADCV